MTWPDIALILSLIVCIAVGARIGSLWTAACLSGGFAGAFLADTYSLTLAGTLAKFPGATALSGAVLFLGGVALMLAPALLIARIFEEGMILGVIDSTFGLFTGALAGAVVVTSVLLAAVPLSPKIEPSDAWTKSRIMRPLHHSLENIFQNPRFRRSLSGLGAASGGLRELEPLKDKAEDKIKAAVKKARD